MRILPGATVTDGKKSNTVFLMIWKPKDFSSEELTGRGSNPSTSSIFTLWSPTVDWMRSRTWTNQDTSYSPQNSHGETPWTIKKNVSLPLVKTVLSEFADLHTPQRGKAGCSPVWQERS